MPVSPLWLSLKKRNVKVDFNDVNWQPHWPYSIFYRILGREQETLKFISEHIKLSKIIQDLVLYTFGKLVIVSALGPSERIYNQKSSELYQEYTWNTQHHQGSAMAARGFMIFQKA